MANMYERLLGDSYKKLHPKLQKRYEITEENSFTGEGKMDEIYGGSFFVKLILKIASKFRMFFLSGGRKCHLQYIIPLSEMNMEMNLCGGIVLFTFVIRKDILMR
ncbi:hypothetical protein BAHan_1961 [Bacillus anthracis]|nr:hypothetical protein BACvac02_1920 [Bacillus anthracis]AIM11092.1 hypothetical protein BAHan_1961 [Bacillus anthracis]